MILLLKNIIFTLVVPGTVAVYIPLMIAVPSLLPKMYEPIVWNQYHRIALILLSWGTAIYLWCLWDFAITGKGTPAPIDAPKQLIVRGLYRYVRNPMYVGVLLVIIGWSIFFQLRDIAIYAAIVWLVVHLFIILIEEPSLSKKFGESYTSYCKSVGRWLPKFPHN